MKDIKVSVVVPFYNAEDFIKESLGDIQAQTLRDIEIICVDDGSTDASADIVLSLQQEDARISLIRQENLSAGAARNNGLGHAKGKYVVFWDADDRFEAQALELLYQQAEEKQADMCVCGAKRYDTEQDTYYSTDVYLKRKMLPECNPFNKYDMPQHIFNFATNVPWNKFYNREFIENHKLRFQEISRANDTYFSLMSLFLAERITFVDLPLITYRINNVKSLSGKASADPLCAYESYRYTYDRLKQFDEYSVVEQSFLNRSITGFFRSLNLQTDFASYKTVYEKIKQEGFPYFGFDEREEEFFTAKWIYDDFVLISRLSAEDFLVNKSVRRMNEATAKKNDLSLKKKELKALKKEYKALNKEKKDIQKSYNKLIKDHEKELKRITNEKTKLENKLEEIYQSTTYKVGRAATALPRAMKEFIKNK